MMGCLLLLSLTKMTFRRTCICNVFISLQNYIYFGNNQSPDIEIYDKTSFDHISSYRLSGRGGITDMAMFAEEVQPQTKSKWITVYTLC